jgi:hypothetical protein
MSRRWVAGLVAGAMLLGGCASIPACLDPTRCTSEEMAAQAAARAQNAATGAAIAAGLGAVAAGAAAGAAAYSATRPVYVAPVYVRPVVVCRPGLWGPVCF